MVHRNSGEREFEEHIQLVADTMEYLQKFEHSKIASRGAQLLALLQQELDKSGSVAKRKRARPNEDMTAAPASKRTRTFDIQTFMRDVAQNLGVASPDTTTDSGLHANEIDPAWDAFLDLLSPQIGFDGTDLFNDLFPVQN